eukprot:CFRG5339T1
MMRKRSMNGEHVHFGPQHFNPTIAAFVRAGDRSTAMSVWREMRELKVKPNVVTYNCVLSVHQKAGEWKEALELLHEMTTSGVQPTMVTYGTVMSACEKAGRVDATLDILETVRKSGLWLNEVVLGTAAFACAKGGKWKPALDLVREMEMTGLKVSPSVYSALLTVCVKTGEWRQATTLFEEISVARMTPTNAAYEAIVHAYESLGQIDDAVGVLEKAKTVRRYGTYSKLSPPPSLYNAVLGVCLRAKKFEIIDELLKEMNTTTAHSDERTVMDQGTCSIAMQAYEAQSKSNEVIRFSKHMVDAKMKFETTTLNIAMAACLKERNWYMAVKLYKQATTARVVGHNGVLNVDDESTYNTLLTAWLMGEKWNEAIHVVNKMKACNMSSTRATHTYNRLLKALEGSEKWQQLGQVLKDMRTHNVAWNTDTYNLAIMREAKVGLGEEKALELREEMSREGVTVNLGTNAAVIEALESSGHHERAAHLYRQMCKSMLSKRWTRYEVSGALNLSDHTPHMAKVAVKRVLNMIQKRIRMHMSSGNNNGAHLHSALQTAPILRRSMIMQFPDEVERRDGQLISDVVVQQLLTETMPPIRCESKYETYISNTRQSTNVRSMRLLTLSSNDLTNWAIYNAHR